MWRVAWLDPRVLVFPCRQNTVSDEKHIPSRHGIWLLPFWPSWHCADRLWGRMLHGWMRVEEKDLGRWGEMEMLIMWAQGEGYDQMHTEQSCQSSRSVPTLSCFLFLHAFCHHVGKPCFTYSRGSSPKRKINNSRTSVNFFTMSSPSTAKNSAWYSAGTQSLFLNSIKEQIKMQSLLRV